MPSTRLHAHYGLHADSLLVIDDVAYTFMVRGPMFKTSRQFLIHQPLPYGYVTITLLVWGILQASTPFVSTPN
jgi:hypothetical protein